MHTILILASLGLALSTCLLCLCLLHLASFAGSRRAFQITGLLVPVLALGLLTALMIHFLSQICFAMAPPADAALAQGLFDVGAIGIASAIFLNGARAVLLPIHLHRRTWEAPFWLLDRVEVLAADIGLKRPPTVSVAVDSAPWALVTGLFRPCLVVSSRLVALLDDEELDAALCHELLHLRRGDLWWAIVGAMLRDLAWFLPVTRRLYGQLVAEQEIACDDQVQGESLRLALASALARVWQAELAHKPAPRGALAFFSPEHPRFARTDLETRVRRLLDTSGYSRAWTGRTSRRTMLTLLAVLGVFMAAQVGLVILAVNSMGCGLHGLLTAY